MRLWKSTETALSTSMLTGIGTTPDTGGYNVSTNALNAVSRLAKENIILAAPLAEKSNVSGRKKDGKRKRPLKAATLKRSN